MIDALAFASGEGFVTSGALDAWLRGSGLVGTSIEGLALRAAAFGDLRGAVVEVFDALVVDAPVPGGAVARLNEASAAVPFAPALVLDGGAVRTLDEPPVPTRPAEVLAAIARSAIRFVGSPDAGRLRRCPACRTFFVASRPDRVWCGAACGNRARVARHHARRRSG